MIVSGSIVLKAERGSIYLWTNQDPVVVTSDNVQRTPLLIKVKQGEGASQNYEAWLTIRVESVSGSTATTLYEYRSPKAENGREYVLPRDKYATANRITVLAHDNAARTTLLDEMHVGIVAESPIPFPCPETEWKASHTFHNGEYLMTSDAVYMWVSRIPGNTSVSPKEYGDTSPRVWARYQKWPLLATAILLADFAKLGSAVFMGDLMFSQQGVDADNNPSNEYNLLGQKDSSGKELFTPNVMVDWLTGYAHFARKFVVFNADNSGHLANGSIYWDSYGRLFRKHKEFVAWRNIREEMADRGIDSRYDISVLEGSYLKIDCYYLDTRTINLPPASETPDMVLDIRARMIGRSVGFYSISCLADGGIQLYNPVTKSYDTVQSVTFNTELNDEYDGTIESYGGKWYAGSTFIAHS